jgi:protein-disulfide isomerase
MRNKFIPLALVLLSFAAFPQVKSKTTTPAASHNSGETPLPSEETVNAFLQQTFGYDSQLTWKIVSIRPSKAEGLAEVNVQMTSPQGQGGQKFYVSADAKHALVGEILPFGPHPFEETRLELKKRVTGPSRGPSDAPVMIVEFSDLQCPHCKEAQPTIDKLMAEEKNARLVFQNFPLSSHDWAAKAAYYGDCIGRSSPDAFWKYVESVYAAQSDITAATADEKLTAIAEQAGVKGADTAACAAKPETAGRVQRSVALGAALEVTGTPTLFINGRKISNVAGLPYEVLKGLTEFAAKAGK